MVEIIVVVLFYFIMNFITDLRYEHHDLTKDSAAKMAKDSGKSKHTIRRNCLNGKYRK